MTAKRKKAKSKSSKFVKIFIASFSAVVFIFLALIVDGLYKTDKPVAEIDRRLLGAGLSVETLDSENIGLRTSGMKLYKSIERVYFVTDDELLNATIALSDLENIKGIKTSSQTNADRSNHTFKIYLDGLPIMKIRLLAKRRSHKHPTKTPSAGNAEKPVIAIVIDDIGNDWNYTARLIAINGDITFAIMPSGGNRDRARSALKRSGKEIILHMPMEPIGRNKLKFMGTSGLFVDMRPDDIIKTMNLNLDNLPEGIGVNNHMGSRFTQMEAGMAAVLDVLKKRNLFFIDSVTSPDSIAYNLAIKYGVRSWARDVFLDTNNSKAAVTRQLKRLIAIAKKNGKALAIGHPRKGTIEALEAEIPNLEKYGVRLVRASAVVE